MFTSSIQTRLCRHQRRGQGLHPLPAEQGPQQAAHGVAGGGAGRAQGWDWPCTRTTMCMMNVGSLVDCCTSHLAPPRPLPLLGCRRCSTPGCRALAPASAARASGWRWAWCSASRCACRGVAGRGFFAAALRGWLLVRCFPLPPGLGINVPACLPLPPPFPLPCVLGTLVHLLPSLTASPAAPCTPVCSATPRAACSSAACWT